MATMNEIAKLEEENKQERRDRTRRVAFARESLGGLDLANILTLKRHWEEEKRKHRRLDEISIQKRKEAEAWLEAIESKLKEPAIVSAATGKETLQGGGDNQEFVPIKEAAKRLNISTSNLYKIHKKIPSYKVGNKLMFKKVELDAFISRGRQKTDEELDDAAEEHVSNRKFMKRLKKA